MAKFNSIDEVWEYLNTIPAFKDVGAGASNFSLSAITEFCREMGNPQDSFPSIHVAGTNGKGTTCYMLEHVYSSAGFKTGMFTSPHLNVYNERFRINRENCSDTLIIRFFNEFERLISEAGLTYFEISTALAFWIFREEQVDIAIIETGLGGLLDSTNIITPVLSIITSISLDHQAILGETTRDIAFQKAGIIKKGVPVITGNLDQISLEVATQISTEKSAELITTAELNPEINSQILSFSQPDHSFVVKTLEVINAWNFAMVYQAVKTLQTEFNVSEAVLKSAFESFEGVPGRFEKMHPEHDWYFSGAHNTQAIESVQQTIAQFENKEPVLFFTLMRDKVTPKVLFLFGKFEKRYFVEMDSDRGAKSGEISQYLEVQTADHNNVSKILNELKSSLVIFAGSFYFYTIIKRWIDQAT
jgi:dihydrofolate synthase/folylpolyglutamate synthase